MVLDAAALGSIPEGGPPVAVWNTYVWVDSADATTATRTLDRIRADTSARIGQIVTPEQRPAWEKLRSEARGRSAGASTGRVWVPGPSGPKPVDVRLGLADGASTEILGGALAEGAEVIVGLAPGAAGAEPAGLPRFRLF